MNTATRVRLRRISVGTAALLTGTTISIAPVLAGPEDVVGGPPGLASQADARQVSLTDVSATGPDDVWALAVSGEIDRPMVLHWNGHRWRTTVFGDQRTGLVAIDALSPTDVWAVGFDYTSYGTTLIEHWDGTSWARVAAPQEPDYTFNLMGIGFITPDDGYAFGALGSGGLAERWLGGRAAHAGDTRPAWDDYVTLHWDGTSWTQLETDGNDFEALATVSPSDAWMVGRASNGTTITQHWDGSSWTVVSSPSRGTDNDLVAVDAIGPHNVWAAGDAYERGTYALHWNGLRWHLVRDAAAPPADILTLSGSSRHAVWIGGSQGSQLGLLERWTGQRWKVDESAMTGLDQPRISSIATISAKDAWAVGQYWVKGKPYGHVHRLILHWDGHSWSRG